MALHRADGALCIGEQCSYASLNLSEVVRTSVLIESKNVMLVLIFIACLNLCAQKWQVNKDIAVCNLNCALQQKIMDPEQKLVFLLNFNT